MAIEGMEYLMDSQRSFSSKGVGESEGFGLCKVIHLIEILGLQTECHTQFGIDFFVSLGRFPVPDKF